MPLGAPVLLNVQAEIDPALADSDEIWTPALREELEGSMHNGRVGTHLVSKTNVLRIWHVRLAPGERLGFHTLVPDYFWTALTPGHALSRNADGTSDRVA
ncbi:hypothetical protein IFT67_18160 [Sphingomonas sp. CFBP 13728]|uniref:hypothetical protein n=1 Tax=unclassified Sphingomonas TaxID=196159 RepID=UPI0017855095|nr:MULTISPECIES: hypothetical protein [unclassified Sphingomonas]MBD8620845.1 hypothetical protein [Sphingomonas sp. CFBP 13728]MBD8737178.1 hypothetical protein [Sphingomonas sp. CFBP 13706]